MEFLAKVTFFNLRLHPDISDLDYVDLKQPVLVNLQRCLKQNSSGPAPLQSRLSRMRPWPWLPLESSHSAFSSNAQREAAASSWRGQLAASA